MRNLSGVRPSLASAVKMLFALAFAFAACGDPSSLAARAHDGGPTHGNDKTTGDPTTPDSAPNGWTHEPTRTDAAIASISRFTWQPGGPLPIDGRHPRRVALIEGGASDDDVAALAHGRPTRAQLDRQAPIEVWTIPSEAPTALVVQPTRALQPGPATLLLRIGTKPIARWDFDIVATARTLRRVWPIDDQPAWFGEPWIACADDAAPLRIAATSLAVEPGARSARVLPIDGAPCAEIRGDTPFEAGHWHLPPSLASLDGAPFGLDPRPIDVAPSPPVTSTPAPIPSASCAEGELTLGVVCAQIDDDRLTLRTASERGALVFGSVGASTGTAARAPLLAAIVPGRPVVVRGLAAATRTLAVVRALPSSRPTDPLERTFTTQATHAHLVVNEALARPRSASATQRFVELANDGEGPASLGGWSLIDGDNVVVFGDLVLPAHGFAVIVPEGFQDGLSGDEAPAHEAVRVTVPTLTLRGSVALAAPDATIVSRLPLPTTSAAAVRHASRGRRLPERPDDAVDAFGWDARGGSTPGSANDVEAEN